MRAIAVDCGSQVTKRSTPPGTKAGPRDVDSVQCQQSSSSFGRVGLKSEYGIRIQRRSPTLIPAPCRPTDGSDPE
jgi:hypothetical protein